MFEFLTRPLTFAITSIATVVVITLAIIAPLPSGIVARCASVELPNDASFERVVGATYGIWLDAEGNLLGVSDEEDSTVFRFSSCLPDVTP